MGDNARIFVGRLDYNATDNDLYDVFEKYGSVRSVSIVKDKETGRPRGFGFVEFDHEEDAQAAVDGANGAPVCGRGITVEISKPKTSGYGGRGGGRGRGGDRYGGNRDSFSSRGRYNGGGSSYGGFRGGRGGGGDRYSSRDRYGDGGNRHGYGGGGDRYDNYRGRGENRYGGGNYRNSYGGGGGGDRYGGGGDRYGGYDARR